MREGSFIGEVGDGGESTVGVDTTGTALIPSAALVPRCNPHSTVL